MLQILKLIHAGDPLTYGLVFIGWALLILAINYKAKSHTAGPC